MKIDEKTVERVAKLARIKLTAAEAKKISRDLTEITDAFKVLDKAPHEEPSFQPISMKNIFREDEKEECLPQEIALGNTKHREKGFFRGPKAV